MARTSLMTLIFLSPPAFRMTVNSVCSSTAGSGSARSRGNGDGGSSRHAPLLLEQLGKLGRLQNGELREIVNDLREIGHVVTSFGLNLDD